MRVLVADGDESFLEIVQCFLWDWGHEAETAADGLECMAILREFFPDVLVLDQELLWGGSDGVLSKMAEDALLPDMAVILTGNEEIAESLVGLSSLPVACLAKPYRLNELLTHIQSAKQPTRSPAF